MRVMYSPFCRVVTIYCRRGLLHKELMRGGDPRFALLLRRFRRRVQASRTRRELGGLLQKRRRGDARPIVRISRNDVAGLPCDAYLHDEAHSPH